MTGFPPAPQDRRPTLSIVVPVFNAAGRLGDLCDALQEVLSTLGVTGELIFVDDGSVDESWDTLVDLARRHPGTLRAYRLARNAGQQAATYCGLLAARGDWVVTIDDDLQPHPREIQKLWARAHERPHDVIYGIYPTLSHGPIHRVGTRVFRMALRWLAPDFPDGSSFRLIRRELLQAIPRHPGRSVLVDSVLAWYTADFATVRVEHAPRHSGRSGYSFRMLFGIACTLLFTYSRVPLRVMTAVGLLSAMISFGLGLYYLVQRLTVGAELGFSALIVTITFSSGLILLSLGMLGEYISRIHTMTAGEPAFTIRGRAGV